MRATAAPAPATANTTRTTSETVTPIVTMFKYLNAFEMHARNARKCLRINHTDQNTDEM